MRTWSAIVREATQEASRTRDPIQIELIIRKAMHEAIIDYKNTMNTKQTADLVRKAYNAYISEGIADSDGNFIPMSFEAFKAWKHETLVATFAPDTYCGIVRKGKPTPGSQPMTDAELREGQRRGEEAVRAAHASHLKDNFKTIYGETTPGDKPVTDSGKAPRVYATMSLNGERVEVIGQDSSNPERALVLSSRGLTSYVYKNDLA